MPNFDSFGFNGETSNGDGKPTDDMHPRGAFISVGDPTPTETNLLLLAT